MTAPDPIADRVLERMAPLTIGPPTWSRVLLVIAATAQMVIALPWLVGADPLGLLGSAHESHLTRDGAFGMAIAVAGAVTAWRHRYALAAAIVAGTILLIQFGTGLIDGHADRVAMWVELSHLPMLVIVGLILVAARPEASLAGRSRRAARITDAHQADHQSVRERLRLVGPATDD